MRAEYYESMTPNDVQIDVLMRRYAKHSSSEASAEHLDPDELSAFAEGAVPPAARTRYVSHLADCDNCRQIVSQLALSAGAVAKTDPVASTETAPVSWSQRLAAFFAPRTLRYAAFAVVLIAAAGIVFLLARRPANNSALVAQNEQRKPTAATAVKPSDQVAPQANTSNSASADANRNGNLAESGQKPRVAEERDESKVAAATVPSPKAGETLPAATPALAMKSSESESRPSYAPPPPGERQGEEARTRPQSNVGGLASGPRKSATTDDKYKSDRAAEPTIAKDRAVYDSNRAVTNQPAQTNRTVTREKRSGPRRDQENVAQSNQLQIEPSQKESTGTANAAKPEAAPETRTVGGRKFRRQGASWIDLKFKTSMPLRTVTRGSDEFSALDSGLRSIASQLGGEIIVVWKNKAYRIH